MARTEARIKTALWTDNMEWRQLTGRAQRCYLMLCSQPTISLCGVVALTMRKWAGLAVDETEASLRAALDELVAHRYIVVDEDLEEVWIRTFLRHDGVWRSPKTRSAALAQVAHISSPRIKALVQAEIASLDGRRDGAGDTPPPCGKPGLVTPWNGVSDGVSDAVRDGVADTSRTRAGAVSVSVPVTDTSLRLPPVTPEDEVLRTGSGDDRTLALAERIEKLCTGNNRAAVQSEARRVAKWALSQLADHRIEEAIGYCCSHPPDLPRGVAELMRRKASDYGLTVAAFNPRLLPAPT